MVQQVNVNGSIHEFPDEASPEMIQAALTTHNQEKMAASTPPSQSNPSDQSGVDTMFGRMPHEMPEFKSGTDESKDLIDNLIGSGAGVPGMKMLGKAGGAGLNLLKEFIQKATQKVQPLEEEANNATANFANAEKEAQPAKTGSLISNPSTQLENMENEIGKHINIEGQHDVNIASGIKSRAKSVEDFWKDSYQKFEDKIRDKQFHMPNEAMNKIGYDMDAIMERVRNGADPKTVVKDMQKETEAQENPFYKHLVSKAPTAKDSNAADFLAKYRDFRDTLGGLKQDLKSEKYGSMEKERIKDAIQKGKGMESQIKDTLNEGLGEYKPEFDWLNKGYAEQVFPLRKNPIVKAAQQGKLSSNVMHDLRTEQPGMPLLRDMVKQDPNLLKNIVGQRYKANANEVFAPNETMRSYLDEMPEFKNLIQQKEKLLKDTAARKDISLKQKMDAENKLNDIKQARTAARRKIGYGAAGALGATIGVPAVRSAGRFLTSESNK